jgi:glucosamine-6-phosphate deaminase
VPDERKAQAVKNCFDGEVSSMAPASALQRHGATIVYLDRLSSSLLNPDVRVERI